MKKNLPYFIVIATLILLIVGVLSTGKQKPESIAPDERTMLMREVEEEVVEQSSFYLAAQNTSVEAAPEAEPAVAPTDKILNIYTDKKAPDNHYAPSGWMGDYGDISLDDQYMTGPHSGTTCVQIVYSGKKTQGAGWAGIFWQNPPNNWGERKGGYDLTGYNKLTFWARGENGGEAVEKFQVGGTRGTYPDSCETAIGPIVLEKQWKQYTINLADQDLSYVSGGFCWATPARLVGTGITFYLDDIRFEYQPGLKGAPPKAEKMPFYIYTERNSVANHYAPSGWMGDYGDLSIHTWTADPHSGTDCIKITYSGKSSQGARWAGMFWQNPPNNWGQAKDGGYDLSNATKASFWMRGDQGGERIEELKVGGISGDYPDSDVAGIGPVVLNKEWTEYEIDLTGKDMSYIIGGFCWATNVDVNPGGCTFYIDDIMYK